jgi:hypothetical protein
LRNKGDGTFEDTSDRAGITRAFGNGLGVVVGDYDGDSWPDVYVANDATANQLWMNRRDGTFEDMGLLSGTAYNAAGRPEGSMGIASGDVDRDGDEDLAVTNLVGETLAYYENDGQGGFDDRRAAVGLAAPTAMMTGFGADWFDVNNDGWLDLFIANGAVNLIPSLRGTPNPFQQQNQLFLGRPDRLGEAAGGSDPAGSPSRPSSATRVRLQEVTASAGPGLAPPGVGRGVAFGDLDLDGRVDLVVSNNNGAARVLRNMDGSDHHWIRLKLTQPDSNRFALGASIRIDLPGAHPMVRRVRSGGSYLSSSDFRLHVGLGSVRTPIDLTVTWPDGTTQRVTGLAVDREHVIARSQ